MLDAKKNKGALHPYLANINVRWGEFDLENLPLMPFEDDENDRFSIRDGDLVMCEGGEPGRCAIRHNELEDVHYQKALHRIRPHEGVDVRWLYYWFLLQSRIGGLNKYFVETTIKHLVGEDLKSVVIDLPDYSEQVATADVLDSLDAKIANNKKLMAELDATARLMYDYWFTQFDFPDENGNPYRSSGGKMVWSDELKRDIPVNWETGSLEDIATLASGATPSTSEPSNYSTEGIAWITPDDLSRATGGMFIGHGKRDVSLSGLQSCSATLLPKGSIILSSRAPIGYLAIALENCCTNQGCKSFIPEMGYGSYFIFFMLGRMMPLIKSQGAGTTFKEVSKDTLSKLRVLLPPKPVVALFEQTIEGICGEMRSLQAEAESLANLRDWLLPMLMNGQTQVTD